MSQFRSSRIHAEALRIDVEVELEGMFAFQCTLFIGNTELCQWFSTNVHEEQDNVVGQSDDMMIVDDMWGDSLTEYGGTQRSEISDDEDEVIDEGFVPLAPQWAGNVIEYPKTAVYPLESEDYKPYTSFTEATTSLIFERYRPTVEFWTALREVCDSCFSIG